MANRDRKDYDGKKVPEGGWGWVVCFASFWTNATVFGINNCFGVLLVAILDDPQLQKSGANVFNTAWVGSLTVFMTFFGTYMTSILTDRFGCRRTAFAGSIIAFVGCLTSSFATRLEILYLTYGIVIGVGFSLTYMSSLIIIGHYFDEKKGKANGFATCGSGVSTVLLPPVLRYLINTIGLWHTLRFIAGLAFLLIPCALVFKETSSPGDGLDVANGNSKNEVCCLGHVNLKIWRNKSYRIWCIGVVVGLLGYFVPFAHLIKYVEEVSPDPNTNGPILISLIGLSSIVGAVAPGHLSDMKAVKKFMTGIEFQQLSFIVIGTFNFLVPTLVLSFPALVVATLIMGIFDGCFVCMMVPVAIDIVGKKDASQAAGFIFCIIALPMIVGGPTAGLIYDITGSYNLAFILAGIPPILGAFIMCFVKVEREPHSNLENSKTLKESVEMVRLNNIEEYGEEENGERQPLKHKDAEQLENIVLSSKSHQPQMAQSNGLAPLASISEVDEFV
ncbi:monocarboxylate transporter 10-like [Ptychodera flava]|uniref:monocarboxylate transporter 10-like n=1 Tax=Ptychodera flava TaxID=63121 RepID=UPI00396A73F2